VEIDFDSLPTESSKIVPIDIPSWKVRRNPFQHALKQYGSDLQIENSSSLQNNRISFAYDSSEDVQGTVTLSLPYGKRIDHLGIKVEFVGRIDMSPLAVHDGRAHYDFVSLGKELAPPGTIFAPSIKFPFLFKTIEKPYETYHGRNVSVRYIVRVAVERKYLPPISNEKEVIVQVLGMEPSVNEPIIMEVGIEDCLHIEFRFEHRCFHLRDVIIGKVNFLLVQIKIKYMELAIVRRETSGETFVDDSSPFQSTAVSQNQNLTTETQTLTKHEVMDGAPVKGEVIPVKLFLAGIPADLTPTYSVAQNNRFSVKYFLNLVLVDEEDRRYFKQQEIFLWRKELG